MIKKSIFVTQSSTLIYIYHKSCYFLNIISLFLLYKICIQFWIIFIYSFRDQTKVFGVTWCMIYSVLGIIGSLIIISLIPLYLPNRSVEVTKSNNTCMLSFTNIFHTFWFSFKSFQWVIHGKHSFIQIFIMLELVSLCKSTNKDYQQR